MPDPFTIKVDDSAIRFKPITRPVIDVTSFGDSMDKYILGALQEQELDMARFSSTMTLYNALNEVGFPLPENCKDVTLVMALDSVFMLRYDTIVTNENLVKLGQALKMIGERNGG